MWRGGAAVQRQSLMPSIKPFTFLKYPRRRHCLSLATDLPGTGLRAAISKLAMHQHQIQITPEFAPGPGYAPDFGEAQGGVKADRGGILPADSTDHRGFSIPDRLVVQRVHQGTPATAAL
jgi:hypothetical protein